MPTPDDRTIVAEDNTGDVRITGTHGPAHYAELDGRNGEKVVRPSAARISRWIHSLTLPEILITLTIVTYIWYFTVRSLNNHHGLGTSSYDSALYDQGVWLLSRFEAPFVTLMGRNLFGDHPSFILLFLVPVYWVFPAAGVLFFTQSAAIGLGALPIFLYARSRLGNEWYALVAASSYLIHPAVGWTNLENFHPDGFLGVLIGFAIYAALENKMRMYTVFVVLSLLVKEDVSLIIVPLGIWVALRRDRLKGLLTIVGSITFMVAAMFLVMRGLNGMATRNSWRIPFGGLGGVADTAVTNPTDLWRHLTSGKRPWYLWQMLAPFAFLFLRLPSIAMISSVVLFTNILSTYWYQYQVEYHYSLIIVPALVLGTVHAIGALKEGGPIRDGGDDDTETYTITKFSMRRVAIATLAVASLIASSLWSAVPWGSSEQWHGDPQNRWAESMRDIIQIVPEDAVVAAHHRVTPHMAHRIEIYQFPTPFRSVLYGPNGNEDESRILDSADRVEYVVLPRSPDDYPVDDWTRIEDAFDVVAANDFWVVYRRDPNTHLPLQATR